MDQNQDRRRGQFHRGRRNPDRRGMERRTPPPQAQEHSGRDHVDVEQIMRDVRARIAQRSGIELSNQQIQELAARRLESILDPRTMKPGLLDEMRKAAAAPAARQGQDAPVEPAYTFDEATLYESHRGLLRFFRRLLGPLLKLLFNPTPIAQALNIQSRLNVEAAQREAERERRQAEWNALHYQIVQRLVTEVSRVSIEVQAMSTRIESLSAKVDFNERRVRGIEGTVHQARPAGRPAEIQSAASVPAGEAATAAPAQQQPEPAAVDGAQPSSEGAKRRRRRRRGRRGGGMPGESPTGAPGVQQQTGQGQGASSSPSPAGPDDESDADSDSDSYAENDFPPVTTEGEVIVQPEPHQPSAASEPAPASPPPTWEPPPTSTEE